MNLTRHNYEEYFLLYIDNELEEEARRWVEQFVKENPDLEEVFHALQHTVLDKDEVYAFEEKDLLYQTTDEEQAARTVPLWRKWIPAIAASVLLLGAGAFWLSREYRAPHQGMVAAGRTTGTPQAAESAQTAGAGQATGSTQTAGSAQATGSAQSAGAGQATGSTQTAGSAQATGSTQTAGAAQTAGSAQSAGSPEGAVPAQSGSTQGLASTQNTAASQGAHATPTATRSIASTQSPSPKQPGTSDAAQANPSTPGTTPPSSTTSTQPVVAIASVPTQPTPAHTPVTPTTAPNDVAVNTASPGHPDKNATGANNAETKSTPSSVTIARTVSYHTLEDADQPNDGNKILFVRTDQVLSGGVKGFLRKASRLIKRSTALNSDNIHPETDSDNKTL